MIRFLRRHLTASVVTAVSLAGTVAIAVAATVYASTEIKVYDPPTAFRIERHVDADGADRIWIRAEISKRLNCDLESGDGPPWVDFYDAEVGVPPPSAIYQPDGRPAGTTRVKAGEVFELDGYSAIVPKKMKEVGGTFVIRIPCQLWTKDEDGRKVWGRKIRASWGPVPVPRPNQIVVSGTGVRFTFQEKRGS